MRFAVTDTDFDGLTCAWLFEKFEDDLIIVPFNSRGAINPKTNKYGWEWKTQGAEFIYFADLCPIPEKLDELLKNGIDFQVIDHHSSSRKRVQEYDKKNGTDLMSKCIFEQGKMGVSPKTKKEQEITQDAALSLVWDYLTDGAPRPPAIQYLNAFDTYRWWTAKDSRELAKSWGKVFFPNPTSEESKQLDEWGKAKDNSKIGAFWEEFTKNKRDAVANLLDHYLELKTDGKVNLNAVDMSVDTFLEKAQEDIAFGKEEWARIREACEDAKKHALVATIADMDFLIIDKNTSKNINSVPYSDLGGSLADYSPNGLAAVYWENNQNGVRVMKFSLRTRSTTTDEDVRDYTVRDIHKLYYFVSENAEGEPVKNYGGGHDTANSFYVNIDEADRVFPDQVLFSDIMATSRRPTDADIVCALPEDSTISSLEKEIKRAKSYKKSIISRAKARKI